MRIPLRQFPPAVLFVLVVFLASGSAFGQTPIILDGTTTPGPVLTVDRSDFDAIDITLSVDSLMNTPVEEEGGAFTLLSLDGYGFSGEQGAPRLPVVREFLEIPYDAECQLVLSDTVWAEYRLDSLGVATPIVPVQPPRLKDGSAVPFVFDAEAYARSAWSQSPPAFLSNDVIYRGRRLVVLNVRPLDYNPVAGTIRVLTAARIQVAFTGANVEKTHSRVGRVKSASFDRVVYATVLNSAAFEASITHQGKAGSRGIGFLMIAAPAYVNNVSLQSLVNLRTSQGFDVNLVDTGTTGTSASSIKSYIQNQYTGNGIEYVLLIGDTDTIPCWTGSGSYNPDTDLNYACVDGSDYIPDVRRGRLSVRSSTQLNNMCDKIVAMANNSEKKAVFMASTDNYHISEGTHNHVINNYLNPAGWTSDKLYTVTYNATTQQVKNSFNAGRSIGTFSGHGSSTSWADGPSFSQSNVRSLTNTVYPFVQSYACSTGDYGMSECFAETWVRDDHGATSFFGASVSSYWDEDDILEKEVFKGWHNSGLDRIGEMLDYGQLQLHLWISGTTSWKRMYFEMYNLMGDPSMKVLDQSGSTNPAPDIKVDGQDGPLVISSSQTIVMTISLDPGSQSGVAHDWWIFGTLNSTSDFWWKYPGTWISSGIPVRAYNGGLVTLNDYVIATAKIPSGMWTFTFAVDALTNYYEGTYIDTIDVQSN
jgi:hypothetical protein